MARRTRTGKPSPRKKSPKLNNLRTGAHKGRSPVSQSTTAAKLSASVRMGSNLPVPQGPEPTS